MQERAKLHIGDPFGFSSDQGKIILTYNDEIVRNPTTERFYWELSELPTQLAEQGQRHFLGHYNGEAMFSLELIPEDIPGFSPVSSNLRDFVDEQADDLFRLLGRALQINDWYRTHRYCGFCGTPTQMVPNERAMGCSQCQRIYYPRLSPCVMALIIRGDECLLARNARWSQPVYSVLAGFIEPGESAEQALEREVMEEVGLQVGAIEYIASQPWPFPGQLMLGFFAEYIGGEIQVDGIEISEAHWYPFDKLPKIPGQFSLSGQLIQEFVQRCVGNRGGGKSVK